MTLPLMPKATAVWLVENTGLSFDQISAFTGLHDLEVQAIADGEVAIGLVGLDPLANGQLSQEEIARCEADPAARLRLLVSTLPQPTKRQKGPRYTPVTKRGDKPDAISWLVREHPELSDAAVSRLVGTTKQTINAVRDRTHWNSPNIKPRSPMALGLCTSGELAEALAKVRKRNPPPPKPEQAAEQAVPPAGADPAFLEVVDTSGSEGESEDATDSGPTSFGQSEGGDAQPETVQDGEPADPFAR